MKCNERCSFYHVGGCMCASISQLSSTSFPAGTMPVLPPLVRDPWEIRILPIRVLRPNGEVSESRFILTPELLRVMSFDGEQIDDQSGVVFNAAFNA